MSDGDHLSVRTWHSVACLQREDGLMRPCHAGGNCAST